MEMTYDWILVFDDKSTYYSTRSYPRVYGPYGLRYTKAKFSIRSEVELPLEQKSASRASQQHVVDVIQADMTYTNIQEMQDESGNVYRMYSEIQEEFRATSHDNLSYHDES